MITEEEINAEAMRVVVAIGDHVFIRFREHTIDDYFNELPPEQRKILALVDGRNLTSADLRTIADALEKLNALNACRLLRIERQVNDVVLIEGMRYSGDLFRQLGGLLPEGRWFRIVKREDGIFWVNVVNDELQAQFTDAAGPPA